jgi:hypothetical protein
MSLTIEGTKWPGTKCKETELASRRQRILLRCNANMQVELQFIMHVVIVQVNIWDEPHAELIIGNKHGNARTNKPSCFLSAKITRKNPAQNTE